MKIKLDEDISSTHDLQAVIAETKDYAKWYSHNSMKKRLKSKHEAEQPYLSIAAKNMIRQYSDKNLVGRSSLDQLISTLEHFVKHAPQMTITLAAPPTVSIKKLLVSWCRDNLSHGVLVNFEFKTGLLGGMVVRSGSHIYDWSFRRQILEANAKFPEVLRRV